MNATQQAFQEIEKKYCISQVNNKFDLFLYFDMLCVANSSLNLLSEEDKLIWSELIEMYYIGCLKSVFETPFPQDSKKKEFVAFYRNLESVEREAVLEHINILILKNADILQKFSKTVKLEQKREDISSYDDIKANWSLGIIMDD